MAWFNPFPIHLIAHQLTIESSRILWIVAAVVIATGSVLLIQGHLYGLMIWIVVSVFALGKLIFDLVNHEALHQVGWIIASVILAVSVVLIEACLFNRCLYQLVRNISDLLFRNQLHLQ